VPNFGPAAFTRVVVLGVATLVLTGCTTISTLVDAYGGVGSASAPTPTASYAPTGLVNLAIGDCLDEQKLEDKDISTDPLMSCDVAHDLEVFGELTVADGDYPSLETLVGFATQGCAAQFKTFVGLDFGLSSLDFKYYYPTESSWANGDRGVDCVVFDPTQQTVGTLADFKH